MLTPIPRIAKQLRETALLILLSTRAHTHYTNICVLHSDSYEDKIILAFLRYLVTRTCTVRLNFGTLDTCLVFRISLLLRECICH